MSNQPTLPGFSNAISSPVSADGRSPCASPDGQTSGLYGPDPALASLSARQAQEAGLLTSGTYCTATGASGGHYSVNQVFRNPALTAAQIRQLLMAAARDLGPTGPDQQFGAGIIDALAAVSAAAVQVDGGARLPRLEVRSGTPR